MFSKLSNDKSREPVIVDYARTPFGAKKGAGMKYLRADDMAIRVWKELRERNDAIDWAGLSKQGLTDSIVGCNSQVGSCALDIGKTVAVSAGFPTHMPGASINRQCASGLQTVFFAMQQIMTGDKEVVVAGGVEGQNSYPIMADMNVPNGRGGVLTVPPNPLMVRNPYLVSDQKHWEEYTGMDASPQGQIFSAEVMGRVWHKKSGLSFEDYRHELDLSAVRSHTKAQATWDQRAKEIISIDVPKWDDENKKPIVDAKGELIDGQTITVTKDESPRNPEGMEAKLGKMRGIVKRKTGYLTAGNSCPTTDGAAGMIITSRAFAEENGLRIRGSLESFATVGSDYVLMLTGPVESMPIALKRAELTMDDMATIEINEAFSTVVYASAYELGFPMDDERLNPYGGAMSLGHPTGATGTRLIGTILNQLEEKQKDVGIASLCVGLGMGAACVVRREI